VLTTCNTGSLATARYGTALGVIRYLHESGKLDHAFCTETRPYNQGARLTAFELVFEKIPSTLVCDNMASYLMADKVTTPLHQTIHPLGSTIASEAACSAVYVEQHYAASIAVHHCKIHSSFNALAILPYKCVTRASTPLSWVRIALLQTATRPTRSVHTSSQSPQSTMEL